MKPKSEKKTPPNPGECEIPSRRHGRVTAGDVARCAGVSQTTVSIVLSERRDIHIPDSTRERVKKCAEELGYIPSLLGEGFLRGKSKIIGVLLLSDSYLPLLDCIAGIQTAAAQNDYVAIVLSSYWEKGYIGGKRASGQIDGEGLFNVRRLIRHQVEGVLYFSTEPKRSAACLAELARHRVPVVTLGVEHPDSNVDFVGGDNQAIGEMAANHLLGAGCTSFAIVKSPLFPPLNKAVAESFGARLKAAGCPCRELVVDEEKPAGLDRRLSRVIRPPTGIFAATNFLTALVMQTVTGMGWRVPEDIAIVGAGMASLAQCSPIPSTIISRNTFVTGQTAVELLIKRINGDDSPARRVLVQPSLDVRQSSLRVELQLPRFKASGKKAVRAPGKGRNRKLES